MEGSGTWYSGRHILPMADGGYVVTSITGSGATVAVARFDRKGMRLWERGITDNDSNLYGTVSFGEQVRIYPRFSYEREDGRIVMFGNEGGSFFSSPGYGSVYQLVLDESTGAPLDTLSGWPDSAASLDNGSTACRMRNGHIIDAMIWPYGLRSDTFGAVYLQRLTQGGRYDDWSHWHSVGERSEGQEIYHYPVRVIQTPDDGFVVFGVRRITGGPATLFLLKIDSAGGKLWESQSKPENVGTLVGAFFDTTADGGFVLLATASYHDTAQKRQRWAVMRLVKCSAEGDVEWIRDYESEQDYTLARRVRQTADGGYLLLGTVGGFNDDYTVYLSSQEDGYLLKLDTTGKEEWRKQWGDSGREDLGDMILLADGSAIVTGSGTHDTLYNVFYLAKIRIGTAGVADEQKDAATVMVHPNPARDRLRVVSPSLLPGKVTGVRLYDLLGRDALGRPVPFGSSGVAEIDVSGLPAGAYRAVVEDREGNVSAVRSVMVVR